MTRVFVINLPMKYDREAGTLMPAIDVGPAEEFGELVFLLPDGDLKGTPAEIVAEIREGLADFGPGDLLLLAGDPRAIAWASAIAAERVPDLPLLHWLRRESRYQTVREPIRPPRGEPDRLIAADGPLRPEPIPRRTA